MYVAVYHYRVNKEKTEQFVMLEKKAIEIYLEHGCLGVEIYRDAKDSGRWMEINRYRDLEHHNTVVSAVDKDPRIKPVFEEFINLFDDEAGRPQKTSYYRML